MASHGECYACLAQIVWNMRQDQCLAAAFTQKDVQAPGRAAAPPTSSNKMAQDWWQLQALSVTRATPLHPPVLHYKDIVR